MRHLSSKKHQKELGNEAVRRFYCSVKKCRFATEGIPRRDNFVRHMRTRHAIFVKGYREQSGSARRASVEENGIKDSV